MSYAFDTLSRAWELLKQELPAEHRDGVVAMRFGFMLEELHDANHRVNDAINKDSRVTADARRLEAAIAKAAESPSVAGLSGEALSAVTGRCFDMGGSRACAEVPASRCAVCPNRAKATGQQGGETS